MSATMSQAIAQNLPEPPQDTLSDELSAHAFEVIRQLVEARSGILLLPSKRDLVISRLKFRLRELGLDNFDDYVAGLDCHLDPDECNELVLAITTNVTHFFREAHHLTHFKDIVMPQIKKKLHHGSKARIWSAGCSDGREAYSIAAIVLQEMPDAYARGLRILATDINTKMLEIAKRGIYPLSEAEKLPPALLHRWFEIDEDDVEAKQQLKQLVSFKPLNLIEPWPLRQRYEAIFCRNVLIYFSDKTQQFVLNQFCPHLVSGGFLYLGHSERVQGKSATKFRQCDVTTYQYHPDHIQPNEMGAGR